MDNPDGSGNSRAQQRTPEGTPPGFSLRDLQLCGVNDGARTRDLLDHNQVLYQLSYIHHASR